MTGVVKLILAFAFILVANVIRYIANGCLTTSEEKTFHFNICICIILGAWIIREGLWW